jgi:hypothetical protein
MAMPTRMTTAGARGRRGQALLVRTRGGGGGADGAMDIADARCDVVT